MGTTRTKCKNCNLEFMPNIKVCFKCGGELEKVSVAVKVKKRYKIKFLKG